MTTEASRPDNHRYTFREPVPTVATAFRRLHPRVSQEVVVVAIGRASSPEPAEWQLLGAGAWPATLVVAPGTEIRIVNGDPLTRRPFGVGVSAVAASAVRPGAVRRWTPRSVGRFEFQDETSPSFRAWVVVRDGVVARARPNPEGEFRLDLPAGQSYQLQAYFEGRPSGRARSVSVGRRPLDIRSRPLRLAPPQSSKGGPPKPAAR